MKNSSIIYLTLAMSCLFLSSCTKEVVNDGKENGYGVIIANSPSESSTRTSLVKNGEFNKVYWSADDVIDVIGKSSFFSHEYTIFEGSGTSTGKFSSSNPCNESLVFAGYPAGEWLSSGSNYYLTVPPVQQYSASGIQNDIIPMYAQGNPTELHFNHIAAIIRLKAYNASGISIQRVEMRSTSKIAGTGGVVFVPSNKESEVLKYNGSIRSSRASYTITLNCEDVVLGTTEEDATEFNFVVFANDDVSGYTIDDLEFVFSQAGCAKEFSISKTSPLSCRAGVIYSFPAINCTPSYTGVKVYVDEVESSFEDLDTPSHSVVVETTTGCLTLPMLNVILDAIAASSSSDITLDLSGADYEYTTWNDEILEVQNVTVVKLPKNISTLGSGYIIGNNVTDIYLPSTFNGGIYAYTFVITAANIHVDSGNTKYSNNSSGWLLSSDGTILYLIPGKKVYTTLTIPEGIEELKGYFYQDRNFTETSIILPSTLETISREAFVNQYALNTIDCSSLTSVPIWECEYSCTQVGKNTTEDRQILVASELYDDFANAGATSGWTLIQTLFSERPWTYVVQGTGPTSTGASLPNLPYDEEYNHEGFWN